MIILQIYLHMSKIFYTFAAENAITVVPDTNQGEKHEKVHLPRMW